MRHHIYAGLVIAATAISLHSETLSYSLRTRAERIVDEEQARAKDKNRLWDPVPAYDDCSLRFSEEKRRELIVKYGLPMDIKWETGNGTHN